MPSVSHLNVLPCSDPDRGTQRCRLGVGCLREIGCQVGSYITLTTGRPAAKVVVCSAWPRRDCLDGYIQFDETVHATNAGCEAELTGADTRSNEPWHIKRLSVAPCDVLDICVVVNDIPRLKRYRLLLERHPDKLKTMCSNCVINLCVIRDCEVSLGHNESAKLYGIHSVLIDKIAESSSRGALITHSTKLTISRVITKDRHLQRKACGVLHTELGGLENEIQLLTDIVRGTKGYASSSSSGMSELCVPQGVLLYGPPGCGKTSLVRYISHTHDAYLISISACEILGPRAGESESNLEQRFDDAVECARDDVCVLFIDEIDSICPKRRSDTSNSNARVTAQLICLLDKLPDHKNIRVIAATNRPSAVDPSLRRPGRFDREIIMGVPNTRQRASILSCLTKSLPLSNDVSIATLAEATKGYVGADLKCLCHEAAYVSLSESKNDQAGAGEITMNHFRRALSTITASTQRGCDALVDTRPVSWADIGGLDEVKRAIRQAVEWPIQHPQAFARLGLPRPKGVLLYGPPGCCKTTLVRAAAASSGATFFSLSSAQLYSPYVGEAERTLTEAFQRARMSRPSLLFLDEIDSVVGTRGGEGASRGVQERLLSTLLNEMDGIGLRVDHAVSSMRMAEGHTPQPRTESETSRVDNSGVLVVAATNRPDMVDEAVLRPGRFDRIIYVPPPDLQGREEILRVHTRLMPVSEDVSLSHLAERCHLFTGADLENLCKEAALYALTRDGLQAQTITPGHFDHVLTTYQPSCTLDTLEQYSAKNTLFS